ncbi:MAG: RsmD family RNA methyltransferase, partial [Planctomycetota bacterium]
MRRGRAGTRIIGGGLKGEHLLLPQGLPVRPMRGRVRESLFGIIGEEVRGARFLDLFAGTGAIAFEALSRGARSAVLVEKHPRVLTALRRNIARLGLEGRTRLLAIDPYRTLPAVGEAFSIVFLDPPFADYREGGRNPWQLALRLSEEGLLAGGGVRGLECPASLEPRRPPPGVRPAGRDVVE